MSRGSDDADPLGLGALLALADFELHTLALVERLEAGALDLGVVDEHVRTPAILSDEAEALFTVEPLDTALSHTHTYFSSVSLAAPFGRPGLVSILAEVRARGTPGLKRPS